MQDLNQSWKSLYTLSESTEEEPSEERLSSIPPLLWSSFYTTLLPFLDYKMGSGGMLVLCWSHRLFEEVANGLYLSSVAIAHARFGKLADYFGGNLNSGRLISLNNAKTYRTRSLACNTNINSMYTRTNLSVCPGIQNKYDNIYTNHHCTIIILHASCMFSMQAVIIPSPSH